MNPEIRYQLYWALNRIAVMKLHGMRELTSLLKEAGATHEMELINELTGVINALDRQAEHLIAIGERLLDLIERESHERIDLSTPSDQDGITQAVLRLVVNHDETGD
jgi:hypothetical protein